MINQNLLYKANNSNQISDRLYKTKIDGLFYISTQVFRDERGLFAEIGNIPLAQKALSSPFQVKQLNHSCSQATVVRGFHAENWNKLVTVVSGIALCVLADVRPDSATFLEKEYFLLSKNEGDYLSGNLFISSGLGNSICVVEGPVNYIYAVDQLYADRDTQGDQAISLFDPNLAIEWPYSSDEMIISDRDKQSKTLRELYPHKF